MVLPALNAAAISTAREMQLLDAKSNYAVPTARKTYLSDFTLALVGNNPRGTFVATPSTITNGGSSTLTWNATINTQFRVHWFLMGMFLG